MANKNKKNKTPEKKKKPEGVLKNPSKTLWGKIMIWILAVAMIAGTIGTLVYLLVEMFNKV